MSLLHKGFVVWLLWLLFLIFLMLRMEETLSWNWFLVFIPMWLFDVLLLCCSIAQLCGRTHRFFIEEASRRGQALGLVVVISKMALQLMVCLHYELYPEQLRLRHILVPAWVLVVALLVVLGNSIVRIARGAGETVS